jgi:acetate kinase
MAGALMRVLALNAGSSSLKGMLCDASEPLPSRPPQPLWQVHADWSRERRAVVRTSTAAGEPDEDEISTESLDAVFAFALQKLPPELASSIDAVGHRVVHGGRRYRSTTRITPEVKQEIAKLAEFAPEHNHLELSVIEAVDQRFDGRVPQFAVFDTAFHATLSQAARTYAGPYQWLEQGIERYGFHGLSHGYAARRAAEMLHRKQTGLRLITCHLGNGCSLAAVCDGKSVDTTMGFTPLEGLMMGTRSGSIDPGILVYLMRHSGASADQLDRILNEESGLKGISGISGDMRDIIEARAAGNARAVLAFDIYAHRLCLEMGGMLAMLRGVDAIVFTGGVGENTPPLREIVCRQFKFAGVEIDPAKNAQPASDSDISAEHSRVRVLVIHSEEDWEIVRECHRLASQKTAD